MSSRFSCLLYRRVVLSVLLPACVCALAVSCLAEDREMLCSEGYGSFNSRFAATGVTLSVEPVRSAAFAARVCSASLRWKGGEVAVTPKASEVDLDVLGVDLGLGPLVAGFQIRDAGRDKLVRYEIYSLKTPAEKLRTLTGGDFFSAADTDMDGRIEIWTNDAGAVDGFENLPLNIFDAAPTVVLRFEKRQLMDVSAEFGAEYDKQIAVRKAELDAAALERFRNSDGKLAERAGLAVDAAHALLLTKVKVLEIVWAYLYSGREQEAWDALGAMWPAADRARIQAAIVKARAGGMQSRVNGVAVRPAGFHMKKRATVFEAELQYGKDDTGKMFQADTAPQEILLRRPPLTQAATASLNTEAMLYLLVDAAGKVRTAKAEGKADKDLLAATAGWKFIPAFKDGRPVASHMRYGVTPYQ